MKKRIPSFLAGAATALALTALATSALAASGQVSFNFANVALNGETKIAAGSTVTVANGQQVPSSILYTDAIGGKTNYLPIRAISELLGVEIDYDSSTRTVLLGGQAAAVSPSESVWKRAVEGARVTYRCDEPDESYATPPAWAPDWEEDGWGLASLDTTVSGNRQAQWVYQKGSERLSLTCSYPCSNSFSKTFPSEEAAQTRQTVEINGCTADFYPDENGGLLAWEGNDGMFFWISGSGVDQTTLLDFARSIRLKTETAKAYSLESVPSGYTLSERSAAGGTVYEVWNKSGQSLSLTWLCTDNSVAEPSGEYAVVTVNGADARFWAASETPGSSHLTVNGVPVEGNQVQQSDVTITIGTVAGVQSGNVSTLVWTDPDSGLSFRLQGALDQETLIRMAEQTAK